MAITTAQCKKFLVDFFRQSGGLISGIYGVETGAEALVDALQEKNWKRESKCKPQRESSRCSEYEFFPQGMDSARGPHYCRLQPLNVDDIAMERVFTLLPEKYDDGVAFVVFEMKDGTLCLGQYVGD